MQSLFNETVTTTEPGASSDLPEIYSQENTPENGIPNGTSLPAASWEGAESGACRSRLDHDSLTDGCQGELDIEPAW
jgi:hypothetical protein